MRNVALAAIRKEEDRERRECLEQERIDRVLADGHALRQANEIRAYVATVRERTTSTQGAALTDIEPWAAWALTQADRLDPVAAGWVYLEEDEV